MLTFHIDGKQTEVAEVTPTLATGTTQKLIFIIRGDQIGLFKLVTLNCILNRITGVTFGC
jgi:hypothetical protein